MSTLFMGLDAGGTSTRALLATGSGRVVGRGQAAGANAWSSGAPPAAAIASAAGDALGSHDPASIAGGVIAVAGGVSSVPEQAAAVIRAWHDLGIAVEPRIILDVVAAFAAGTAEPRGLVLAAGTGAVAALVDDGELVRRAGGRGWLVGDEGSAVWLGIEGVRAALLALDGRGPETELRASIASALEVTARADVATAMTDVVYAGSPAALGRLAPLVVSAAGGGDEVAGSLLEAAVSHLVGTGLAAAGDEDPEVVVLAGSLLAHVPSLGGRVRSEMALRWPSARIAESASGEAGATALAIRWSQGKRASDSALEALGIRRP
ncbi:MAG: BadF/BadG/BcrA/BcrD ATPase family protein [Candidatus Limnocylindrales bacterium]